MVDPPPEFVAAAKDWVCVRVTDMRGVDIARHRFDFDLTFAALLMHADGTVYHRYGARDHGSAMSHLSMTSLLGLMARTLGEHRAYAANPSKPPGVRPRTITDLEPFARKDRKKRVDCIHCHMVNEAEREVAIEAGRWTPDSRWLHPASERVGVRLDRDDQSLMVEVLPDSPAARAGIRKGERLLRAGGRPIASLHDLTSVLDETPAVPGNLEVEVAGPQGSRATALELPEGWKAATPLEFSWRPSKWGLRPGPGFGGKELSKEERERLGLSGGAFGMRVTYIIDWGDDAGLGRSAQKAGLRKGDILLSVAGVSDFASEDHFQAWFRLTRKPGETVALRILRDGHQQDLQLPVLP